VVERRGEIVDVQASVVHKCADPPAVAEKTEGHTEN